MPLDPFAGDPNDPASFITDDDDYAFEPLTPEEVAGTKEDLAVVLTIRPVLESHGVQGVAVVCEDCEQMHFYNWDILIANMRAAITNAPQPVHEPGLGYKPENYVSWDYCLGYRDGMERR